MMTPQNIKASIILPVYNAEKYIGKCIDSVLLNTADNFELIIVNDGSSDESDRIISSYADTRIVYIKQNNSGVSKARNLALDYANGEYVIFIDADDYLTSNSLDNRLKHAEKTDLLISGYYKINVNAEKCEERIKQSSNNLSVIQALSTLTSKSTIGYQGYLWNKVFRRSIVEQNNIRFDESIAYGEDRLFVAEYIIYCNSINTDSNLVYCYRDNADGAMNSFSKINADNSHKVLSEFKGLDKLNDIVKRYDIVLARYIIIQSFFTAIYFARNADNSALKAKKICVEVAWKCLKSIIMFPNDFYNPMCKIKAIGHFLLLR